MRKTHGHKEGREAESWLGGVEDKERKNNSPKEEASKQPRISAHAKAAGLPLVTNNEREFRRVSRLKVQNWAL